MSDRKNSAFRVEADAMGKVQIPKGRLWGAQTQRSLQNFKIGHDFMPIEVIEALALIKECCAIVNKKEGHLDGAKAKWIVKAAKEVQQGHFNEHFPLSVWQTGSGTQTNMNVNEVIANRAIQLSGGKIGSKAIHPNDDVNKSQSSNDTFPSAMRISLYLMIQKSLFPALKSFEKSIEKKQKEFKKIIKIGRTHLMDAVPLSMDQEFSAFYKQIVFGRERINRSLQGLLFLPVGGTAVGTGLNSPPDFGEKVCHLIRKKKSCSF